MRQRAGADQWLSDGVGVAARICGQCLWCDAKHALCAGEDGGRRRRVCDTREHLGVLAALARAEQGQAHAVA